MAPIAAGAQDYQVCWIFKASGGPPFLRWQTARSSCPRRNEDGVGEGLTAALDIRAVTNESAKR
jgi:hypothetical protein